MLGLVFKHQDFDLKSLIICKQKSGRVTAAGHRAAVVIKDVVVSGSSVLRLSCQRERGYPICGGSAYALIPYQKTSRLSPLSSTGITAIGDFESFDDSRLRRNSASVGCEGQCGASVVGHSLRPTASVQCEYGNAVSCGR